jgi:hypothetical protein
MHRAGWCCVHELRDGIGDQAPDRRALAIAFGSEFVGAAAGSSSPEFRDA